MDNNSGRITPSVGDIAKAADSARSIVTDIIDRFFPYCGLNKKALDIYISEIEKSDKPKEYKAWEVMRAKKEFKKLKNIKSIVEFANEYCTDEDLRTTSYSDNEEWYDHFFEKAGYISDEGVQKIWGRILANEFKEKGVTPRAVINILTEIDSNLANAFSVLCRHRLLLLGVDSSGNVIRNKVMFDVVFFKGDDYYTNKGLDLSTLNELESIGLIKMSDLGYNRIVPSADKVLLSDGSFTECIKLKTEKFSFGTVMLTKAGQYICKLISPPIAKDQHSIMKKYYTQRGYQFEETNKYIEFIDNTRFLVKNKEL